MIEVRMDYATMNFAAGKMDRMQVGQRLLGQTDLAWTQKGCSEGSPYNSPMGLRWQENSGFSEMPHKLQVSGVGCEHFALTLPELRENCRFSRLDFAFDVLVKREDWRDFICSAFAKMFDQERKQRKRFKLTGDGEAMTIYIGSRSCAKYFRIYNKTLQDPKYSYEDGENIAEVDEEHCVIRYEVELHRFKDSHRLYDPSPLFDWYYSDDKEQQALFAETIRELWLDYGNDILLPDGFADAEITTRIEQKRKFCAKRGIVTEAEMVQEVQAKLHDYPRTFERTLQFVVERYGKYLPYILADMDYRKRCFMVCEREFGFAPEFYIEAVTPVFTELDDLVEPDFDEIVGDQLQVEEFTQNGGGNVWS